MNFGPLIQAIRKQDWHNANEQFAQAMSAKIADRLASERKEIFKEESQLAIPHKEVQRVYDEIGSVSETEILCNVRSLRVNGNGQVISYVGESALEKSWKFTKDLDDKRDSEIKKAQASGDKDRLKTLRDTMTRDSFERRYGKIDEAFNKVRAGQVFTFRANMMDKIWSQHHNAEDGQKVKVIQLPSAPKPGTMGQCHIADAKTGEFLGMVSVNSLLKEAFKGNLSNASDQSLFAKEDAISAMPKEKRTQDDIDTLAAIRAEYKKRGIKESMTGHHNPDSPSGLGLKWTDDKDDKKAFAKKNKHLGQDYSKMRQGVVQDNDKKTVKESQSMCPDCKHPLDKHTKNGAYGCTLCKCDRSRHGDFSGNADD